MNSNNQIPNKKSVNRILQKLNQNKIVKKSRYNTSELIEMELSRSFFRWIKQKRK